MDLGPDCNYDSFLDHGTGKLGRIYLKEMGMKAYFPHFDVYDPDDPDYGTFWLTNVTATLKDNTVIISCNIALPAISKDFGGGFVEAFAFPEGVVL